MSTTSDDTLQLLEDVALPVLRRAYFKLGHLQWSEAMIRKVLKKHIVTSKDKVWLSYMEESDARLKKLSAMSKQVREIVHKKELHGGE